jgi:hypothetical protein
MSAGDAIRTFGEFAKAISYIERVASELRFDAADPTRAVLATIDAVHRKAGPASLHSRHLRLN